MKETITYQPKEGDLARIQGREDLGVVEVYRVSEAFGVYQADVVWEDVSGRHLQSFPIERLEPAPDLWSRMKSGQVNEPIDFLLKQLAFQIPLQNTGGQLSNSRTDLLPHQILLTRDVVTATRRRFLIADEVGLGKTIEVGMILRELISRGEARRILVITPAGLVKNWQRELKNAFRLDFEILGVDFVDQGAASWETHRQVIASIDTLKRPQRMERLLAGPRWDVVVFDEAHHLSRLRYGKKISLTQNYRLAEALRAHTRDMLFLSATPHQGNSFQFWSLIQLLDDTLFDSEDAMMDHRGFLSRVMIRRTKREVTDKDGNPIFVRRQVHTQAFYLAAREKNFYDKLTDYLREGYSKAGLGQAKTTSQQRAIGFVMTTFQKIMSSSMRAIRQALRRRLLVLLIHRYIELENRRTHKSASDKLAGDIMRLTDDMRAVAATLYDMENNAETRAELDAYVTQMRQRISRNLVPTEDSTEWALDGDEEGDEGLYAETDIPDEIEKVRSLLNLIPDGVDRKFETLTRAIDLIRKDQPEEKFIIFTQYVETLWFLQEKLEAIYGENKVSYIKGGSLDDKIAAMERFWDEKGAQFLICTSAGGEGINLQVGHILFNYDLPWNPMAVEQRIGRIHRYGQKETTQVYNLVAEDTVEKKIYELLEMKLGEIAHQIGKVDSQTGQPQEDFRAEILGFLGSSPDYLELYKKALFDKDYQRTPGEIEEAMQKALQASEALKSLTQDMKTFNLQDYLNIEGRFSLADLKEFAVAALLRLGGSVLPQAEYMTIITPKVLLKHPNVSSKYELATFDRDAAMRKKSAEFLGLGHPLVDALIDHFRQMSTDGDVAVLRRPQGDPGAHAVISTLFSIDLEGGKQHKELKLVRVTGTGDSQVLPEDWLIVRLRRFKDADETGGSTVTDIDWRRVRESYEGAIGAILSQMKGNLESPVGARVRLLGIAQVA